jgi:hypothetical protein
MFPKKPKEDGGLPPIRSWQNWIRSPKRLPKKRIKSLKIEALKHTFTYVISSDFLEKYLEIRKSWLSILKNLGKDDFETNEATIGSLVIFRVSITLEEGEIDLIEEFIDYGED